MMKALYSGVSGLKVHNQRMDVIGNNISNVNTAGYKASTVTFNDTFYQTKSTGTTGDITSGGRNSNQVGYGAQLGTIGQLMTQSGLTYSDRVTDCAIEGEGFFQVMDAAGNVYYTRNGAFHIDNVGNLCDAQGNIVLGVSGDPTNVGPSSNRINLYVPPVENNIAKAEKVYKDGNTEYNFTVEANAYGENGNISINLVDIGANETPFATQNDRTITVRIDMDQDFIKPGETNADGSAITDRITLEQAINQALAAGGIEVPGITKGGNTIRINCSNPPENVHATSASNTIDYKIPTYNNGTNDVTPDALNLEFTAATAGAAANKYEINIVTYTASKNDVQGTDSNGGVKAEWAGDILTIKLPTGDEAPNAGVTVENINKAIEAAKGGGSDKIIAVTAIGGTAGVTTTDVAVKSDQLAGLAKIDPSPTIRLGLKGGKDNFYKSIAQTMASVKLNGGSVAADQTTKDLESMFIDDNGVIYGVHAIHGTIALGRIDLALFENPEGLDQVGNSYWKESLSSGGPEIKQANDVGSGSVVSTALEMSNADLSQEVSDMIITQRGFQANSRIITVSDTMLEELVNLKR